MKTLKTLAAAAILSLGLCGSMRAETKPEVKDTAPVKVEVKPETPGVLTEAKLKEMLELLGYDVRVEKLNNTTYYWIFMTVEGIKYDVSIQLSPNMEKIWTIVPLADIKEEHLKMSERWVKLTELNDAIGPCYFRYNVGYKRLYLSRACDNRGMTAKLLRDHLERHLDRCAETKDHWMIFNTPEKPANTTTTMK